MRVVLWIGNEPNQRALAHKIQSIVPLSGIITETRKHKRKLTLRKVAEKGIEKLFLSSIGSAWWGMLEHYNKIFPAYPEVPIIDVENINSEEAFRFSKQQNPDLIIVSGTRLIKEQLLSLTPGIGILNLHTGLSPYIKGGPNCTNWCIATEQFHLIGNTIMWIDRGIDTGNILTTEFTDLDASSSLPEIHLVVMEHAHSLYVKAINHVISGTRKSVAQSSIAKGRTYYSKEWTLGQKLKLVKNLKKLKKSIESGEVATARKGVKVVSLDGE